MPVKQSTPFVHLCSCFISEGPHKKEMAHSEGQLERGGQGKGGRKGWESHSRELDHS